MIAVQLTASLAALGGLLLLFFTWRRRGVREGVWRFGLPAGWLLILFGLAGWMFSTHPDQGLALGTVAVMLLACTILTRQGLMLLGKPARVQPVRETETDSLTLGKGYWGRFTARLLGSLVIVPAFGLLAGLLWRGYAPGDPADRLIWSAIIVTLAMTGALVYLLASRRPYRASALIATAGVIAAAFVYLPILLTGA